MNSRWASETQGRPASCTERDHTQLGKADMVCVLGGSPDVPLGGNPVTAAGVGQGAVRKVLEHLGLSGDLGLCWASLGFRGHLP